METVLLVTSIVSSILALGCLVTVAIVVREVLKNAKSAPDEIRQTLEQVLIHFKAQNLNDKASYDAIQNQNAVYLKQLEKNLKKPLGQETSVGASYTTDVDGKKWRVDELEPVFDFDQPEPPLS